MGPRSLIERGAEVNRRWSTFRQADGVNHFADGRAGAGTIGSFRWLLCDGSGRGTPEVGSNKRKMADPGAPRPQCGSHGVEAYGRGVTGVEGPRLLSKHPESAAMTK